MNLSDLPTLRQLTIGAEQVYHLEDPAAYRRLCERLYGAGFDFPQCLSGVDMSYGLRTVLNLRRLRDQAEVTLWIDVPYDRPHVPSVCDLWGGTEWHEREAYDLLGIHYDGHPDLRRILLEEHWSIHPLQRRYDTGGYLIPEWQPEPWPDWAAMDREAREKEEAAKREAEAANTRAGAADASSGGAVMTDIRSLNANFAGKLQEQGVATVQALAALTDEQLEPLASKIGLKSPAAVKKWREGAQALLQEQDEDRPASGADAAGGLTQIRALNANYAAKLREQGITSVEALAGLSDEQMDALASKVGLKSAAAVKKWREGALALLSETATQTSTTQDASPSEDQGQGGKLTDIRTLNANFAAKLEAQGISTPEALAGLSDAQADELASALGLKSAAAVNKWRDGARELLGGDGA